jgi:cyclopropane-fatty-acyl-phospholipid synthase
MTTLRAPFDRLLPGSRGSVYREHLQDIAARADIHFNGNRPWDMQVHDQRTYQRILSHGSIGAGEAYMDGWWDCAELDSFFCRVLQHDLQESLTTLAGMRLALLARWQNLQTPARAQAVAHRHYDLSPRLYQAMLDRRMIYSCGYWADAGSLDEAQAAKLDLICRKLGLQSGMRVLDIGCGWGGAARFAAEHYDVTVTGVTLSCEQAAVAKAVCNGLPVQIITGDYRALHGKFDRIMSIGMFEHVGYKNYRTYFRIVRELLEPDGLFLLHTIGSNISNPITDPWIEKYIFPNSMLPSITQIGPAMEKLFVLEDWHSFGADYDRTLMCWHQQVSERWQELADLYDERFRRMWCYYLLCSAGSFRARCNQLWQLLLSPSGVAGGWCTVR